MRRRDLLVGGAGLLVVAVGGAFALVRRFGSADGNHDDGGVAGNGEGADEEPMPPFELRTLSPAVDEEVAVPAGDRVEVVNFARTYCPTAEAHIGSLAEASETLREEGIDDVRLVTLVRPTEGPTETDAEFREWWDGTDGDWTLAMDDGGRATDFYAVDRLPTSVIADAEGEVRWRGEGLIGAEIVANRVRDLTEAES